MKPVTGADRQAANPTSPYNVCDTCFNSIDFRLNQSSIHPLDELQLREGGLCGFIVVIETELPHTT